MLGVSAAAARLPPAAAGTDALCPLCLQGPFGVRAVSPNRMIQLFMSRHAPGRAVHVVRPAAAAAASSDATPAAPAPAADLVAWVQQSGGSVSGVAVQRDAEGFGLAAAADCAAGSTLVSLPQRCHLTYGDSSDPRLLALINQVPAELWGAKLALAVAAHRLLGTASPFRRAQWGARAEGDGCWGGLAAAQ